MNKIDKFVVRLKRIGINIQLSANYPWIYLDSVNNKEIWDTFRADHGFTAFFFVKDDITWSNRRAVFKKIREML